MKATTEHVSSLTRHPFAGIDPRFVGWVVCFLGCMLVSLTSMSALAQDSSGALSVSSVPTGAMVFLDGEKRCRSTPCRVNKVPVGKHRVLVIKGTKVYESEVAVEHGKTQRVKAKLKLASAQVNISTSHDDVIVSVDGTELGTPPLQTTLSSGTHTLSVDGEFVFPFKEKFIVGSESLELELQLEEAAVVEGAVSPQDAKIMWNGQQLSGPSFKRKEKPGDYKLAVEHKDFPPMEMPVKLRSGKKTTLTIDLSRKDASVVSNGFLRDDRYDAWFGTSIAVTGVAVAVGVASLGMYWSIRPEADSAYDRYRASAFRDPDLARDFRDLSGQLNTWEIVGWSMLGVGLVAGTSAFLAWYFGRQEGVQGKKGTVTLYPVLDRNGLGLGAAMVF